jgi:ferrous iron transport protein A
MTSSLTDVRKGQRCRIEQMGGAPDLVQRLMEFGILEGEEIEVIGFAPLGDPMELQAGGTRLSLRRAEAADIRVTILS